MKTIINSYKDFCSLDVLGIWKSDETVMKKVLRAWKSTKANWGTILWDGVNLEEGVGIYERTIKPRLCTDLMIWLENANKS